MMAAGMAGPPRFVRRVAASIAADGTSEFSGRTDLLSGTGSDLWHGVLSWRVMRKMCREFFFGEVGFDFVCFILLIV